MWRSSPTQHNEPVYIALGIQLVDFMIGVGVFLFFFVIRHPLLGFAAAAAVAFGLSNLKRNFPQKAWRHWLHAFLPGPLGMLARIRGMPSPRHQHYSLFS